MQTLSSSESSVKILCAGNVAKAEGGRSGKSESGASPAFRSQSFAVKAARLRWPILRLPPCATPAITMASNSSHSAPLPAIRAAVPALLAKGHGQPCSAGAQAFASLVPPTTRFQVALDTLLPILERDDSVRRIFYAVLGHTLMHARRILRTASSQPTSSLRSTRRILSLSILLHPRYAKYSIRSGMQLSLPKTLLAPARCGTSSSGCSGKFCAEMGMM